MNKFRDINTRERKSVLNQATGETTVDLTRFDPGLIPIFNDEDVAASAHGFTEINSDNYLGWERDDVMIIRFNDPDGVGEMNRTYHAYKREVDGNGNFTGNAKAIEINEITEGSGERRGEAKQYSSLAMAFAIAKAAARNQTP